MKILHLSYDHLNNPWVGGGGAYLCHEVYRRLCQSHDITVLCGGWPGGPGELDTDGVRYAFAGSAPTHALSRLRHAWRAARRVRSSEWDLVVDDISPFSPTFSETYSSSPSVSVLLQESFDSADKYPVLSPLLKACLSHRLKRQKHFIVLSESLRRKLDGRLPDGTFVEIVPPGVDAELLELPSDEEPYILFLGRLDPYNKGLDCLAEAFQEISRIHPDVKLCIAGRGPKEEQVRAMFSQGSLTDCVELLGFVDTADKHALLSRCLFVAMPSRYEGWGIVATEANAAGKPVVGFDIQGLRDSVSDGETGLLVPLENVAALSQAMLRLLEDDELRHDLGHRGRERARERTWDKTAQRYDEFFHAVLARSGT